MALATNDLTTFQIRRLCTNHSAIGAPNSSSNLLGGIKRGKMKMGKMKTGENGNSGNFKSEKIELGVWKWGKMEMGENGNGEKWKWK